jgi:chromosome segregation ATPase
MSDQVEEKVQEDAPETVEEKEVSAEDLQAELEKLKSENERLNKEKSGVDKSVNQLQQRLKALEEEKLSSEELAAKRLQEERETLLTGVREAEAGRLGLPEELADLVKGSSYDEVKARAEMLLKFKSSLLAEKDAQIEELRGKVKTEGLKTPEPKAGEAPKYDMASKMPDFLK